MECVRNLGIISTVKGKKQNSGIYEGSEQTEKLLISPVPL